MCAGVAEGAYTGIDMFVDRATNPLKDAGSSLPFVLYQTGKYGCSLSTEEHVKAYTTFQYTYGTPGPLVPGTKVFDLSAAHSILAAEARPEYRHKVVFYDPRYGSNPAFKK